MRDSSVRVMRGFIGDTLRDRAAVVVRGLMGCGDIIRPAVNIVALGEEQGAGKLLVSQECGSWKGVVCGKWNLGRKLGTVGDRTLEVG